MTEEQATKIIELLDTFTKVDGFCAGLYIGLIVITIAFWIFLIFRTKQIKKWRAEYKATLTDEQLEAIKRLNKIQ